MSQPLSPQDFLIIAHWGVSFYAPENTMAAFDLALVRSRSYQRTSVFVFAIRAWYDQAAGALPTIMVMTRQGCRRVG